MSKLLKKLASINSIKLVDLEQAKAMYGGSYAYDTSVGSDTSDYYDTSEWEDTSTGYDS